MQKVSRVPVNSEKAAKIVRSIKSTQDKIRDRIEKKNNTSKKSSDKNHKKLSDKSYEKVKDGIVDQYEFISNSIPVKITVEKKADEFVPIYSVQISQISDTTEAILEKIRRELIKQVNLGIVEIQDIKKKNIVSEQFEMTISLLLDRYFPDIEKENKQFLKSYLVQQSLGMGDIEILMNDPNLEEIAINGSYEAVWVYHKSHGWLKTNVKIDSDDHIKHYATMIGRKVGRQISVLEPLLDAHMNEGDRANATLYPISSKGNTITLRKFSRDPWTITKFVESNTMSLDSAALIWLSIHYELSAIIAGGTASGKTSALNVLANFFPPNQRIISIEDTREIRLPKFLHWIPMSTRNANAEGKGEVTMEDLLVNALRQRPDRILVGEVRRKREAETLFEAIHTGHSCYATFHANSADEAIKRLTNKPIEIPKNMVNAISLLIIQFRNRRSGLRRTFQLAEIDENGDPQVLLQYDAKKDAMNKMKESRSLYDTLQLYTGCSRKEIISMMEEKKNILKYLVKNKVYTVDEVGRIMAEYYTNKDNLMGYVKSGKTFFEQKAEPRDINKEISSKMNN